MEFIVKPKELFDEKQNACATNALIPVSVCGANFGTIVSIPGACGANYGIFEACGAFICGADN